MNKILRAAVFGLAMGTALFFVPFLLRFVLSALLAGFIFRLVFRRRRRYPIARWQQPYDSYEPYKHGPMPIDGKWYRPGMQQGGPENKIPLH